MLPCGGCGRLGIGAPASPPGDFHKGLLMREDEGILGLAVAEDRALLRSNLSAAAVQWHGDAARTGRRSLAHYAIGPKRKISPARPLRACLNQEVR